MRNIRQNTVIALLTVAALLTGVFAGEVHMASGMFRKIVIDGASTPNTVDNNDRETDCTVAISLENLNALLTGQLNPVTGFMSGKFKVSGDMSVAMKLQRVV